LDMIRQVLSFEVLSLSPNTLGVSDTRHLFTQHQGYSLHILHQILEADQHTKDTDLIL
jgi:hypothetical protein